MVWDLDNPDIPVKKPKEISMLEAMGRANRDSMPPLEMDEKVEDSADAVARSYRKFPNSTYGECVTVVSVALNVTGSALGGSFGDHMMSKSESEAVRACKLYFDL
jgi:hypothetical protein